MMSDDRKVRHLVEEAGQLFALALGPLDRSFRCELLFGHAMNLASAVRYLSCRQKILIILLGRLSVDEQDGGHLNELIKFKAGRLRVQGIKIGAEQLLQLPLSLLRAPCRFMMSAEESIRVVKVLLIPFMRTLSASHTC